MPEIIIRWNKKHGKSRSEIETNLRKEGWGSSITPEEIDKCAFLERKITILNAEIVYTYEILEATDITEYGNLSDTNKNAYNRILQCGIVDISDGTVIRTNLWAMFDCDSDTRAALIELLGE